MLLPLALALPLARGPREYYPMALSFWSRAQLRTVQRARELARTLVRAERCVVLGPGDLGAGVLYSRYLKYSY
jgi:hypothetical protein